MKTELHLVGGGLVTIDTKHLTPVSLTQYKRDKQITFDRVGIHFKEDHPTITVLEEYEALKTLFNMSNRKD